MGQYGLEGFVAYDGVKDLVDFLVIDMAELKKDPRCYRLTAQRVASADSICSSIEEGYGRLGRAEYVRFLDFTRGSARETRGRYERLEHWIPEAVIQQRVAL